MKAKHRGRRTSEKFPGVTWVDAPSDFITVDPVRCTGCGSCVKVCLAECFEIRGRKARVRSLKHCMECASCWYVCPEGAVSFRWPRGGTGFGTGWG